MTMTIKIKNIITNKYIIREGNEEMLATAVNMTKDYDYLRVYAKA